MKPVRMIALGGLISATLTLLGGALERPGLIGIAGAVMLLANIYALVRR